MSYRFRGRKRKFAEIYKSKGFGGEENPLSGTGSTLAQTEHIRSEISRLLQEVNAASLVDAPCGDFTWMKEVDIGDTAYLGIDIVGEVIRRNISRYSSESVRFLEMDIVSNIVPAADIILCRDCFVHLSNKDIIAALDNFKESGSVYLLTTTFTNLKKNTNLVSGRGWRPINLGRPPFDFPQPIRLIDEKCTEEDGLYSDKCLGLWFLKDL